MPPPPPRNIVAMIKQGDLALQPTRFDAPVVSDIADLKAQLLAKLSLDAEMAIDVFFNAPGTEGPGTLLTDLADLPDKAKLTVIQEGVGGRTPLWTSEEDTEEDEPRSPSPHAPRHGHEDYAAQLPLHAAARAGDFWKIHAILDGCTDRKELGEMLARPDGDSDTPLHACLAKEVQDAARAKKCISTLLSFGADVNAADSDKVTALHACAMRWDEPEIIGLLLDAGADLPG